MPTTGAKPQIDTDWFRTQFEKVGLSQNAVASELGIDRSALSRAMSGGRKFRLSELRSLSRILRLPEDIVLAHVEVTPVPSERPAESRADVVKGATFPNGSENGQPLRHPIVGVWKGLVTLDPSYDYTQPADPEWGKGL